MFFWSLTRLSIATLAVSSHTSKPSKPSKPLFADSYFYDQVLDNIFWVAQK